MRLWRFIVGGYVALCVAAVALMVIGVFGLLGQPADPLGAAYAIILSMPWVLMMNVAAPFSPLVMILGLVAAMALNAVLLWCAGGLASRVFRGPGNAP